MDNGEENDSGGCLGFIIVIVIIYLIIKFVSSTNSDTNNYYDTNENTDYYSESDDRLDNEDNVDTFHGYECTEDCSGHEAGYEWADENEINSIDDCGGNSNSFIEGCQAYVEENY